MQPLPPPQPPTPAQRKKRRNMILLGCGIVGVMFFLGSVGLAALGVAVIPKIDEAKREQARMDMQAIAQALALHKARAGAFPSGDEGLEALVAGGILERMPRDPWGQEYAYALAPEGGTFTLASFGEDGRPGGTEFDADVLFDSAAPSSGESR